MKTLRKASIMLISLLVIFSLSISAFAESYTQRDFSLNFQGCIYTSRFTKDDDTETVTIHRTAFRGSDNVKVTICDSTHRPVSNTVTISGAPDVKYLSYNSYIPTGGVYYLRFCSENYVSISGYLTL